MSFTSRKIFSSQASKPILTWASTTLPISGSWSCAGYSNGNFLCLTSSTSTSQYSIKSTDGITWSNATGLEGISLAYTGTIGYMLGIDGSAMYSGTWPYAWLQSNSVPVTSKNIIYNNGVLIAVTGRSDWSYRSGGPDWTYQSTAGITIGDNIAYGNGYFVSIRGESLSSNQGAYTNNNGISWTNFTVPLSQSWQSIAYGNGVFVIVALGSSIGVYSTNNGLSWDQFTIPGGAADWSSVTYGNGTFVAVAKNSTRSAYSYNGINWSELQLPGTSTSWDIATYGNGRFVAIASNTNRAAYTI